MTKREYFANRAGKGFLDNPEAIISYCKRYYPEDVTRIIQIAEDVSENCFTFDQEWDLEQVQKQVRFEKEIDWEINPDGDPEFIWQFNRHRNFICLGQAYSLTKKERYAKNFVRLLTDWMERLPWSKEREKTAWRSLEAGFRGEYWTKAMDYFKDSPFLTDEIIDSFYQCLLQHARYLEKTHSDYKYTSNWGIIENHGLFEIAMVLQEPEKTHYASVAIERLHIAAGLQIMRDGTHWEQSPLYHQEVLHCLLDVILLAAKNGILLPEKIVCKGKEMLDAMLAAVKPDGRQFMNGDSDDMDMKDSFQIGACLFKDPVLKYVGGERLSYESIWTLGIEQAENYEKMEKKKPCFLSKGLIDSGNYYFRSDWGKQANVLHFHCGTLGSGHGHADQLHIDLVMNGRDVLIDSGRYTYAMSHGRIDFKNPPAHNTIIADGKFFIECQNAWGYERVSMPVNTRFYTEKEYGFVQGAHLGYKKEGIWMNRKIVYIKPDIYIIADECYGKEHHTYEAYFHFSEKGKVTIQKEDSEKHNSAMNDNPEDRNASGKGLDRKHSYLAQYQDEIGMAMVQFFSQNIELEQTTAENARHYNQKSSHDTLKVKGTGCGMFSLFTVISGQKVRSQMLPVRSPNGKEYPKEKAEAIKITAEAAEYVIIFCYQEGMEMVQAEECKGIGTVILFRKGEPSYGGHVLLY